MSDDSLGFMLADTARHMRRIFQKRLSADALTFSQARALIHVNRNPGIRQVMLAELLEVQPITLARLVDQLQECGLVERRPDPEDRRAYQLFITPAAEPQLERIRKVSQSIYGDVMADVTDEEIAAFMHLLSKICGALTALEQ